MRPHDREVLHGLRRFADFPSAPDEPSIGTVSSILPWNGLKPAAITQRAFFCPLHAALHVDKSAFSDHYASTKIQSAGEREDRETRIGIDRGFFL